jgi:hypothetical protein
MKDWAYHSTFPTSSDLNFGNAIFGATWRPTWLYAHPGTRHLLCGPSAAATSRLFLTGLTYHGALVFCQCHGSFGSDTWEASAPTRG